MAKNSSEERRAAGTTVDRKRSIAAKKGAATRARNRELAGAGRQFQARARAVAGGLIALVLVVTAFGIKSQLDAFAAGTPANSFVGIAGRCLDNYNAKAANANRIDIYDCNNGDAQHWTISADPAIKLTAANATYCLDVANNSKSTGAKVQLYTCNKTTAQQFKSVNGQIVNQATGYCVTTVNGASTNGTQLWMQKCIGSPSQKWTYTGSGSTTPPTTNPPTGGTAPQPTQGTVVTVADTSMGAVQSAINTVVSGGTVEFPAGTYTISSTIGLKANVLYESRAGAVLKGTDNTMFNAGDASGIKVDGLTFDGGNLQLGSDGTLSSGVSVTNSTFRNVHTDNFGAGQALFVNRLANSNISYNTFLNNGNTVGMTNAFIFYNSSTTTVSYNTFTNNYQGMHVQPENNGSGSGLHLDNNTFNGLTRMGIEVQGSTADLTVSGNTMSNWVNDGQGNKIGLSIVPNGDGRTKVTNNTLKGGGIAVVGIEFKGSNGSVTGNTIDAFQNGISISAATGTDFSGNIFTNIGQYGAFGKDGGYTGGEHIGTNTIDGRSQTGWTF